MIKSTLRLLPLICLFFTSCTTFKEIPNDGCFEGIAHSLDRKSDVSLFFLHGMSGFSEHEPYNLMNFLASDLDLSPQGEPTFRMIENEGKKYGWLRKMEYLRESDGGTVTMYSLDWRDTTDGEKKFLQWLDLVRDSQPSMASYMDVTKGTVVNMGLGDIALYLGLHQDEICYPIKQSLRWICNDTNTVDQHELICITMSFGGVVLMDTLDSLAGLGDYCCQDENGRHACRKIVEEITGIFVLSNPIPLFALNRLKPDITTYTFTDDKEAEECECCNHQYTFPPPCPQQDWQWEVENLGMFMKEKHDLDPNFRIVAMTDPNDIFSYSGEGIVVRGKDDVLREMFTTAYVRNVTTAMFGVANPKKAHSTYGCNGLVVDLIANGLNTCKDSCDYHCVGEQEDQPVSSHQEVNSPLLQQASP